MILCCLRDGTASRKKLGMRWIKPGFPVPGVVEEESVMALTNTNVTFDYGGDLKISGHGEEVHN